MVDGLIVLLELGGLADSWQRALLKRMEDLMEIMMGVSDERLVSKLGLFLQAHGTPEQQERFHSIFDWKEESEAEAREALPEAEPEVKITHEEPAVEEYRAAEEDRAAEEYRAVEEVRAAEEAKEEPVKRKLGTSGQQRRHFHEGCEAAREQHKLTREACWSCPDRHQAWFKRLSGGIWPSHSYLQDARLFYQLNGREKEARNVLMTMHKEQRSQGERRADGQRRDQGERKGSHDERRFERRVEGERRGSNDDRRVEGERRMDGERRGSNDDRRPDGERRGSREERREEKSRDRDDAHRKDDRRDEPRRKEPRRQESRRDEIGRDEPRERPVDRDRSREGKRRRVDDIRGMVDRLRVSKEAEGLVIMWEDFLDRFITASDWDAIKALSKQHYFMNDLEELNQPHVSFYADQGTPDDSYDFARDALAMRTTRVTKGMHRERQYRVVKAAHRYDQLTAKGSMWCEALSGLSIKLIVLSHLHLCEMMAALEYLQLSTLIPSHCLLSVDRCDVDWVMEHVQRRHGQQMALLSISHYERVDDKWYGDLERIWPRDLLTF